MMTRRRVTGGSAVALMTAAVVLSPTAADAASPAKTTRTVEHDVTLPTQIGEDERCGLGRIAETQFNRLQMNQLTELADGSFHFTDFETGTTTYEFLDADVDDIVVRRTNTFHMNLTMGGTVTMTENIRETDGNLTVIGRYHLTEVRGEPVVERSFEHLSLETCPQ